MAAERFKPVPDVGDCWQRRAAALGGAGISGRTAADSKATCSTRRRITSRAVPTGPVDPIVASKKRGHGVFIANCAQCHQASGLGQAGQFPPLVASEWVVGDAPKRLPNILLHGIQGTIHVKGEVYNNQMPAWAGVLSDKQISDVLTYMRG